MAIQPVLHRPSLGYSMDTFMTTFKVSPEVKQGLVFGVRMPARPELCGIKTNFCGAFAADVVDECECAEALTQARKDALPFEDQGLLVTLQSALKIQVVGHEHESKEVVEGKLYDFLSWQVEEVHVCTNEEAIREDQFCDVCDCKRVLRIVTKP